MKKNNKGFVLAEAIIVSVFVLGMFTYLAMNVIPLISRYERVVNYDNPQEIYLANTLYEEMLNVENINSDSDIELSIENTDNGSEVEPNLTCTRTGACTGSDDFYTKLGKALKIEAIYTYDTTNPNKNCKSISNDKGLRNYCEYYTKRKDKAGNQKTIKKAFMIKFSGDKENISGDKENISGDKENNSNKAVNKKYATIVVSQ